MIEWIVLDINTEEHKMLLISKYGLDSLPFGGSFRPTWEDSSIRTWLNSSFIENSFNNDEQSIIMETTVSADVVSIDKTEEFNDTVDKIFLLSKSEVTKYLPTTNRTCRATPYANAQGAQEFHGNCVWWVRSSGVELIENMVGGKTIKDYPMWYNYTVDSTSSFGTNLASVKFNAIRPSLWVEMEP